MNRRENEERISRLFDELALKFGDKGTRAFRILVEHLGGMRLVFPTKVFDRNERNEKIRQEFTGFNHVELADRYNLKARQIRRIVDKDETHKNRG